MFRLSTMGKASTESFARDITVTSSTTATTNNSTHGQILSVARAASSSSSSSSSTLSNTFQHQAASLSSVTSQPSTVLGVHHLSFRTANCKHAAFSFGQLFGLESTAERTMESGSRGWTSKMICGGSNVRMVFTNSQPNTSQHESWQQAIARHGDCSISHIALAVKDEQIALKRALEAGATLVSNKDGPYEHPVVSLPGMPIHHVLIEDHDGTWAPAQSALFPEDYLQPDVVPGMESTIIDHLAIAIEPGTMDKVLETYSTAFGFEPYISHDAGPAISVSSATDSSRGGLTTRMMAAGNIIFVFVEPEGGKGQIQEFLDYHRGPGVAHIALSSTDAPATVGELHRRGLRTIHVPETYYTARAQNDRIAGALARDNLDLHTDLEPHALLVDAPPVDDADPAAVPYLIQTFTAPVTDRPTLYMEIIDRRNGCTGFGKGNIAALFNAMEQAQLARGNL